MKKLGLNYSCKCSVATNVLCSVSKSCYQDISWFCFFENGPPGKAEPPRDGGKGEWEAAKMLSQLIHFHTWAHVGESWVMEHRFVANPSLDAQPTQRAAPMSSHCQGLCFCFYFFQCLGFWKVSQFTAHTGSRDIFMPHLDISLQILI